MPKARRPSHSRSRKPDYEYASPISDDKPVTLWKPGSPALQAYLEENRSELLQRYETALRRTRELEKRLTNPQYGNITGIGVELEHKRGLVVAPPRYCITVMVGKKKPEEDLLRRLRSRSELERNPPPKTVRIPKSVQGIRVKVQEASAQESLSSTKPSTEPNQLMVLGGTAIRGLESSQWGTLGIVFHQRTGPALGMTCEHVLSSGIVQALSMDEDLEANEVIADIGVVSKSQYAPRRGVDASIVRLNASYPEGVRDLSDLNQEMRYLVEAPRRASYWSWFIQCPVKIRGARTGQVVSGRISMPTVHSIQIRDQSFRDLFIVQSAQASAAIVQEGDSGAAIIAEFDGEWIWIGTAIAMLDKHQIVASKLPASLKACQVRPESIPLHRHWRLENSGTKAK